MRQEHRAEYKTPDGYTTVIVAEVRYDDDCRTCLRSAIKRELRNRRDASREQHRQRLAREPLALPYDLGAALDRISRRLSTRPRLPR